VILETIVTTRGEDRDQIAPMGIRRQDDLVIIAPFRPSATLDSLLHARCAALNFTDDVRVFAGCLTGRYEWPTVPARRVACNRLADAGFPVLNHTVLLRGVNDDAELLGRLFRGLVRLRVRPYYLLQADPVQGTGHLRTPLQTGIDILERLQGRLSGIALPKLIVDTPGGQGKVPLGPDYIVRREPGKTRLRTHRGVEVDYLDPPEEL